MIKQTITIVENKALRIIKAKHLGFCFGVKRSIELANGEYKKPIATWGELIHNAYIVDKLKHAGINSIETLDGFDDGTLILRSHGAELSVIVQAKKKGLNIVDATCPFVEKTRKIIAEKYVQGYKIVIFGKKNHPEVVGLNSLCNYEAIIIENDNQKPNIETYQKIAIVSQTTASAKKFSNIIKKIEKDSAKTVEIFDTICYTTMERQEEAEKMSKFCDTMLVIGDESSSNTNKLKDICLENCKQTYLVESVLALKNIKFKNVSSIVGDRKSVV